MKKIVFGLVILFIASQLFVSCSSENEILSQFSKRKYLKKVKDKNVKYDDKIGELENELAYEEVIEEKVYEPFEAELISSEELTIPSYLLEEDVDLFLDNQSLVADVERLVEEGFDWISYNREVDYADVLNYSEKQQHAAAFKKSSADPIILAILSIFLPPLAVYLYEDTVTTNFWVDLIATLLFWVPGMIIAFLVCFADVSF